MRCDSAPKDPVENALVLTGFCDQFRRVGAPELPMIRWSAS